MKQSEGYFPPDPVHVLDSFLASRGLYQYKQPSVDFSWKKFYAGLLQHKLTISQIEEMTLPEALLYTVQLEDSNSKDNGALVAVQARMAARRQLSIEDRIELSKLLSSLED